MANVQFTNFAASTLASGITAGDTSITVATGQGALFPTLTGAQYFYAVLQDAATGLVKEIIKVTARTTDTLTATRAQEGTSASAFIAGDKIELRLTAAGVQAQSTETGDVLATGTQTLTNKRITPRVGSTTSSATPTINTDNVDIYQLTAQTVDITSFTTNLSGTPTEGQVLIIEITGTAARAITWGASFESSTVTLPSTTVTTAKLTVGFLWNSVTSKWRCVASV